MSVFRESRSPVLAALVAAAGVLVFAATAGASGSSVSTAPTPGRSGAMPGEVRIAHLMPEAGVATATGVAAPYEWCCPGGSPLGLTVTGQATVHGQGTSARDAAIAKAVADATAQAKAAAAAASITLGTILNLQISASPYPYPVPVAMAGSSEGAARQGAAGSSIVQPRVCPSTGPCQSTPIAAPVETFASVTVTWAIS